MVGSGAPRALVYRAKQGQRRMRFFGGWTDAVWRRRRRHLRNSVLFIINVTHNFVLHYSQILAWNLAWILPRSLTRIWAQIRSRFGPWFEHARFWPDRLQPGLWPELRPKVGPGFGPGFGLDFFLDMGSDFTLDYDIDLRFTFWYPASIFIHA